MHRIAPQPSLPEFYVEAGYLNDFSYLWKIRYHKLSDPSGLGELDIDFLTRWLEHRFVLWTWRMTFGTLSAQNSIVRDCITFMDALVLDWRRELSGKPPELPLDIARLEALGDHRNKINAIPGDKWEIKY